MSAIIHTIYELRLLQEKLESGQGLTMEEIVELERLEAELQSPEFGRKYRRLDLRISVLLRSPGKDALVQVGDLSPGGMRLIGCPELAAGQEVVLHLREDDERSFRFRARVAWIRAHQDQHMLGVRFVGHPMKFNHGPPSAGPDNIVDKIRVA